MRNIRFAVALVVFGLPPSAANAVPVAVIYDVPTRGTENISALVDDLSSTPGVGSSASALWHLINQCWNSVPLPASRIMPRLDLAGNVEEYGSIAVQPPQCTSLWDLRVEIVDFSLTAGARSTGPSNPAYQVIPYLATSRGVGQVQVRFIAGSSSLANPPTSVCDIYVVTAVSATPVTTGSPC